MVRVNAVAVLLNFHMTPSHTHTRARKRTRIRTQTLFLLILGCHQTDTGWRNGQKLRRRSQSMYDAMTEEKRQLNAETFMCWHLIAPNVHITASTQHHRHFLHIDYHHYYYVVRFHCANCQIGAITRFFPFQRRTQHKHTQPRSHAATIEIAYR